jgi:hypothetical protein
MAGATPKKKQVQPMTVKWSTLESVPQSKEKHGKTKACPTYL